MAVGVAAPPQPRATRGLTPDIARMRPMLWRVSQRPSRGAARRPRCAGRRAGADTGWAAARRPCRVAWLDPGMDKGRPTEGRRAPGVVEAKLRRELSLARLSA